MYLTIGNMCVNYVLDASVGEDDDDDKMWIYIVIAIAVLAAIVAGILVISFISCYIIRKRSERIYIKVVTILLCMYK